MASFKAELPTDLIEQFKELDENLDDMFDEMVDAGANVIYNNLEKNMNNSFKSTSALRKGLVKSKPKRLRKNDGSGSWVGFDGYDTSQISKQYPKGKPIPLIAMAREYGTSRGEAKKPFLRPAVNKSQIESAMASVQAKYIKEK